MTIESLGGRILSWTETVEQPSSSYGLSVSFSSSLPFSMSTAAAAAYHHHPTTALANTSSMLEPMLNTEVLLVTADGKVLLGKFKGFDQSLNVVLSECKERVYSMVEGVETLHHGLYLIRGDDV